MEKGIHRSKGSTNAIFNIFTNFRQLNINGHFKKTKKSSRLLYLYRNSRELFFCKITDCKLPFFPRFLSVVIMISILPLRRFYVIKTAWFRFWIFYCLLSLCYCYFITNSKKSFDVPKKKIWQLSHLCDFLLTQLSSSCFLTKSSLKFSILLFVFLLSEIVTVHFIFVYVTISRTDYH